MLTGWREHCHAPLMRLACPAVALAAERRRQRGQLDDGDLLLGAARLLRNHPAVRRSRRNGSPTCWWTSSKTWTRCRLRSYCCSPANPWPRPAGRLGCASAGSACDVAMPALSACTDSAITADTMAALDVALSVCEAQTLGIRPVTVPVVAVSPAVAPPTDVPLASGTGAGPSAVSAPSASSNDGGAAGRIIRNGRPCYDTATAIWWCADEWGGPMPHPCGSAELQTLQHGGLPLVVKVLECATGARC